MTIDDKILYYLKNNLQSKGIHLPYGQCQICDRIIRIVIDHDHDTGNIRGFLCQRCNSLVASHDSNNRINTEILNINRDFSMRIISRNQSEKENNSC